MKFLQRLLRKTKDDFAFLREDSQVQEQPFPSIVFDAKGPLISPWVPTTNPLEAKILGKLTEEGGELVSAASRAYIQGIDEVEPITKKPNRLWLMEEIADVQSASELAIEHFKLDEDFIATRKEKKKAGLRKWHQMLPLNL